MTKLKRDCSKLPLRTIEEDQRRSDLRLLIMVVATEISLDTAEAAVFIKIRCHFALKDKERIAVTAFLGCFHFAPEWLWQEFSSIQCSWLWSGDRCLVSPIRSPE